MSVTDEMVDDFLCTAFEGGSNSWIDSVVPVNGWPEGADYASEVLTRGGDLRITTDENEVFTLTLDAMREGIRTAAEVAKLADDLTEFWEQHDAGDADRALQFALFKEVVYG